MDIFSGCTAEKHSCYLFGGATVFKNKKAPL